MELLQNIFSLPYFWIFSLVLALIQEGIFWFWKADIFDWNPETGYMYLKDKTKNPLKKNSNDEQIRTKFWQDRKKTYDEDRKKRKLGNIYRFILEMIGVFIGWNLIYFFVIKFFCLEVNLNADLGNLWNLLILLIVGLIGISGRIPVIIDSVQDWFKR